MTRKDLDIAIGWAAEEGWNPGLYDRDCFFNTDPHGFFIGLVNNEPIACISAVKYNEDFGFMGFYIVKKEYRGKGFGLKIWNEAIKYLGNINIGLDGVLAQQENYKKSGFKFAYRNIRFQGKATGVKANYKDIVDLSFIPFDQLISYDNKIFPASRPQFLQCWINQPESLAIGTLQYNKITGYGVIRKCRKGYKIGPLFADNEIIADKLFLTLNGFVEKGTEIYLDVPEINPASITLAKRYRMEIVFETARMYSKNPLNLPINKIYGVTSFELG